jgi:hypothetical protein
VNDGALRFNGNSTTGDVTVNGGTLGGIGMISGAVTLGSGGHLAPGASVESLGVGALTTNVGSILDFELGPPGTGDVLTVAGSLTINGGSLNLTDMGGMGAGLYTLIDYGTFSGSLTGLGTPTGPAGYAFELIDTGSTIELAVTAVPEPSTVAIAVFGLIGCICTRRR